MPRMQRQNLAHITQMKGVAQMPVEKHMRASALDRPMNLYSKGKAQELFKMKRWVCANLTSTGTRCLTFPYVGAFSSLSPGVTSV